MNTTNRPIASRPSTWHWDQWVTAIVCGIGGGIAGTALVLWSGR